MKYQQFIDYLFYKSRKSGAPMSGTFELTSRCNLDCRMCYIHKRANDQTAIKSELSASDWINYAKEAQKSGMLLLLLTGGEPLLRPDFREIYTACINLGILISINTNGTLIDESTVGFFKKNPPLRVNLTLYGASPETYQRLCGDPTAYNRAYKAVELLTNAGIRVKLNFSATPENSDDLPQIYKFAKEKNLLLQVASYMFPPLRACEFGDCAAHRLTPEQAGKIRWSYDEYRFDDEKLRERAEKFLASKAVPDEDNECQELPTERIRCRAGSTTFWMTWKGDMRPCGMMTTPSISVIENGFQNAWSFIKEEREKIMLPAKCTACKKGAVCELCPAACYAENGDYTVVPEYLCHKLDAFLNEARNWLDKHPKTDTEKERTQNET